MKLYIKTILIITALVMAAACAKLDNPLREDILKKSILFVMDETILEGSSSELTSVLIDEDNAPLAGKKIRIIIKSERTVNGVTKEDGIALIPLEPLKAGTYSARAFFDGDNEYYYTSYDFTIRVLNAK